MNMPPASFDALLRLGSFALVLLAMMLLEAWAPRRDRAFALRPRWTVNLSLTVLGSGLVRLVAPAGLAGVALVAAEREWGLLSLVGPTWVAAVAGFVLLDLVIYLQHVMVHRLPLLWRLHKVHHLDPELDATTGVRFHPLEILVSWAIKAVAVLALGVPAGAVVTFEIVLNACAMFNHANWRLAPRLDTLLQWVIVTPDMHRIHHSVSRDEHDTNFGFNLPWWDWAFGTYRSAPRDDHRTMPLGLDECRVPLSLLQVLGAPFIPRARRPEVSA